MAARESPAKLGAIPVPQGDGISLRVGNFEWAHDGKVVYRELLRGTELSVGIYSLPAGAFDPQSPHAEDEIYYILEGYGTLKVGQLDHPAVPGAMIYVPAGTTHRFHSIRQSIVAMVVFAPPEGTRKALE